MKKKKLMSNDDIEKKSNKPKKIDIDLYKLFKLVTRVIRPEVPYMEKQQNSIPKKSNIK